MPSLPWALGFVVGDLRAQQVGAHHVVDEVVDFFQHAFVVGVLHDGIVPQAATAGYA